MPKEIEIRQLDASALKTLVAARPGLIPCDLDIENRELSWIDLGEFHCYQGFFSDGVALYRALRSGDATHFHTSLNVLESLDLGAEWLAPTAFIFHAGRCGSTLLAKAIARSRANLVFGEAAPHNHIWKALNSREEDFQELYRKLLLAMGRRRLPAYQTHIIKFTSYNILRLQFIRSVFPEVPAIFLFREPEALLNSYRRSRPSWMGANVGIEKQNYSAEDAIAEFYRAALSTRDENFHYLDYSDLTPATLPAVLQTLKLKTDPKELRLMVEEFHWDAKSGIFARPFKQKSRGLQATAPAMLYEMYQQLRSRSLLREG